MTKKILIATFLLIINFGFAQEVPPKEISKSDEIYSAAGLPIQPEYPGGIKAFFKYFENSFNYANLSADYDKTKTLRVYVQYVVEKDGSITNIKLLRDPGFGAGTEVVRILKADTTKWNPGKMNDNTPVRTQYNLPVTIGAERTQNTHEIAAPPVGNLATPLDQTPEGSVYNAAGLQVAPNYPGGIAQLYKDIKDAVDYKKLESGYEKQTLRVYLAIVIEKDGTISKCTLLRDPGFNLGTEVKRVTSEIKTKWSPGIQNGKPVRAVYNLPITFAPEK